MGNDVLKQIIKRTKMPAMRTRMEALAFAKAIPRLLLPWDNPFETMENEIILCLMLRVSSGTDFPEEKKTLGTVIDIITDPWNTCVFDSLFEARSATQDSEALKDAEIAGIIFNLRTTDARFVNPEADSNAAVADYCQDAYGIYSNLRLYGTSMLVNAFAWIALRFT